MRRLLLLLAAVVSLQCAGVAAWYNAGLPQDGWPGETRFHIEDEFTIATNLWHHHLRYYAVVLNENFDDPQYASPYADVLFTHNVAVCKVPVSQTESFYRNIAAGWVPGTTLFIDFPFPAFPENMGHWVEELLPIYSGLTVRRWAAARAANGTGPEVVPPPGRRIARVMFANLRRSQVESIPWVMEMIRLALGPALEDPAVLPPQIWFDELETQPKALWAGFERVLHIRDRYKHPQSRSGFYTPQLARAFREAAYAAAGVARPPGWDTLVPPRTITYLMSPGGEQVVNNAEVMAALHEVGAKLGMAVRPYTVTPQAPFASFVSAMAKTGLVVARHGPLLANSVFLPPGAMVLELLPYNWEWQGISEIYVNMTRSMGDLHHFAWKAQSAEWVAYASDDDAKYSHWEAWECSSRYCLEAHARAGMLVDVVTVKGILQDLLPSVVAGSAVDKLAPRRPWPQKPNHTGGTGLWWDIDEERH